MFRNGFGNINVESWGHINLGSVAITVFLLASGLLYNAKP